MNYPSLSLKQNLIDDAFSVTKYEKKKYNYREYSKKYDKIQKELRLQSDLLVEECDQCEFKTSKFKAMYRHKRENHLVLKLKCADCDYSNIYPNRIKQHFNQVHRGMIRRRKNRNNKDKCRRESCENLGTQNCLELQSHSLYFCKECKLSFEQNESLKFHTDKIHEGLVFKSKKQGHRPIRFCKEEGCTYKDKYGTLKRHMETKHEGIVRFYCRFMNCNFRSSAHKGLRRHAKTHEKETSKMDTEPTKKIH